MSKITLTGISIKHKIRDADGKIISFTQKHRYIKQKCPKCKDAGIYIYPAINQCKCGCLIAFCSLNDDSHRIGLFDLDKLKTMVEQGGDEE